VSESLAPAIRQRYPGAEYNREGRTIAIGKARPVRGVLPVGIVTAGTSDIPVAEEARATVEAFGHPVRTLYDVGVAGIHRLLAAAKQLRGFGVIIVAAGMEGALPSVIGGLVDRPVVAVPTSVGYGTSFGGIAALLGMLNTCAPGVTVVNIDNGFGAAVAAVRINSMRMGLRR
ncbi:MAG: nickel pincer cofactor biosynthesis protein LarB, partial [Planctomycetota bacterium]|nr:nickel pincer cofactor biosynthesis protein LarB [Planctomycetota bacterium]